MGFAVRRLCPSAALRSPPGRTDMERVEQAPGVTGFSWPYPHFDHHAGWQIGPIAYRLASEVQDPALQDRLASALGGWPATGPGAAP